MIVGAASTVTVKGVGGVLVQPGPDVLRTLIVALYTPATVFAGTVIPIGLTGNAVKAMSLNPAASAAASKSIVYWLGVPVVPV